MVGGQGSDASHRVIFVLAIGRKVSQVGNARDKAAIALTIDHRPVPNSVHVPLLPAEDGNAMLARVKI
jgi:hypothetical protein